jgi:hypothetical protein
MATMAALKQLRSAQTVRQTRGIERRREREAEPVAT